MAETLIHHLYHVHGLKVHMKWWSEREGAILECRTLYTIFEIQYLIFRLLRNSGRKLNTC